MLFVDFILRTFSSQLYLEDKNDRLLSGYLYNWDIYSLWLCT